MMHMAVLKGASGTGKGSRTSQLIEFLKTKEQPVHFLSEKRPSSSWGLLFKKFGIMFIGCYVESNKSGLTSWTSMDMIHATVKKAEIGREVIKEAIGFMLTNTENENTCLVLDGEPMLLSDKFRPSFIEQEYKPDHLMISYFMYKDREEYDQRIMGRSGVKGGDSGWSRVAGYSSDFNKSKEEAVSLDATQCHISMHNFDETIWKWGSDLLTLLKIPSLEFSSWAQNNSMIREIGKADPLKKTKKLWGN